MTHFTVNNLKLGYYNDYADERRLEVPLLKLFVDLFRNDTRLMEVGAVSCHHFPGNHEIYDATEKGAINSLAEDLNYKGRFVASISTIEHIGKPDYGLEVHPYRCITVLNNMLEASSYLITFPIGYNKLLDSYIKNIVLNSNPSDVYTFHRDEGNDWYLDDAVKMDYAYGNPFIYGNGVCLISNLKEFTKG